jgi:hypothetical protein
MKDKIAVWLWHFFFYVPNPYIARDYNDSGHCREGCPRCRKIDQKRRR